MDMLKPVHLKNAADAVDGLFQYLRIGSLNGHMLHVLQAENRTLDFHVHPQSDELFYCIEGAFSIELDDGTVPLSAGDMLIIPKGLRHRPVCKALVKCLLIELEGTLDDSNTGGAYR